MTDEPWSGEWLREVASFAGGACLAARPRELVQRLVEREVGIAGPGEWALEE
ncbi:hypothetical protein [Streptomyces sp. 6N106]|uniref:hypothetical protein n=1 Tax=Streptomyces sp. 6N106 TaxID=3457418 RepID=UPI003FD1B7A3